MRLLPPNSTLAENALVEVTDTDLPADILRGFKYHPADTFLPWLIWEYGLGEIQSWFPNPRKLIEEGLAWQRIRGTPASLRIALSWAGVEDIFIEEEIPGEHFAEFQIGVDEVPNDLFIDAVVALAKLSVPVRTKLMRMYNEAYDIRRFLLDSSPYGDLLSDYSGVRLRSDWPVLSFGRGNRFSVEEVTHTALPAHQRLLIGQCVNTDHVLLDYSVLGITPPHTLNHEAIKKRDRVIRKSNARLTTAPLDQIYKYSKAEVILSDSWHFGDINGCLPVTAEEEQGSVPILDVVKLGDHYWNLGLAPINERFTSHHERSNSHYPYPTDASHFGNAERVVEYRALNEWPILSDSDRSIAAPQSHSEKEAFQAGCYGGITKWYGHAWQNRPWTNTDPIVSTAHQSLV